MIPLIYLERANPAMKVEQRLPEAVKRDKLEIFERYCFMGIELLHGMKKQFWKWIVVMAAHNVNEST